MGRFNFYIGYLQQQRCKTCLKLRWIKSSSSLVFFKNSLAQACPGLHIFSDCDKTGCFKGKGTLKKHNFLSGTRLVHYFKLCTTKTVLTDQTRVQSKVENVLSHVPSAFRLFHKLFIQKYMQKLCKDLNKQPLCIV